jgi:hypothetical protein
MQSKQIFLSPFGGAPKDGKPLKECACIVHDESLPPESRHKPKRGYD